MPDSVVFYIFAVIAVVTAALMVTRRNAWHGAVCLITTLLATAGIFLQLHAGFLFIVQIILHVSGVMVLFVFVIMCVNLNVAMQQMKFARQKWVALMVCVVLVAQLALIIWSLRKIPSQGLPVFVSVAPERVPPTTQEVAKSLFGPYLLSFEIVSVMLLVAMIGAVALTKKKM